MKTSDWAAGLPMMLQVLQKRRRASHLFGVGALGSFQVTVPPLSDPAFPHNEYFDRHRDAVLPLTMRFANVTFEDDAALDVRGASMRLGNAEAQQESFEMVLNTGRFSAARNLAEFARLVLSKWAPQSVQRAAIEKNPLIAAGGAEGLRRAPESYGGLHYYSQIVRTWTDLRGTVHLVRYRLKPRALGLSEVESGVPDEADRAAIWLRGRRPNELRAKDYLRQELRHQLGTGEAVEFVLQAQFHEADEPAEGKALEWYNAGALWNEELCPWRDLGVLTLTQVLNDVEAERLRFNPGICPRSMGIPASTGPLDYRSLGDAEVRVMRALSALRIRVQP